MKIKTANWKFMMTLGMLFSIIINLFIILFAAFIFNGLFAYSTVKEVMEYAIPFSLFSPLLVGFICGIVIYRHSNNYKIRNSLAAALLTAIISFILLVTVTNPSTRKLYDNYEDWENPPHCR